MMNEELLNKTSAENAKSAGTDADGIGFAFLFGLLRRFWIFLLAMTLAGAAIGFLFALKKGDTVYTASKSVLVFAEIDGRAMTTNVSLTNRLIPSVRDQIVTQPYIAKANENYATFCEENNKPEGKISGGAIGIHTDDSLIFTISYTDENPDVAKEKLQVYIDTVEVMLNSDESGLTGDAIMFSSIDYYPSVSQSSDFMKYMIIFTFGGLLVGAAVVLVLSLFDPTVNDREELERLTGAHVIGYIDDIKLAQKR